MNSIDFNNRVQIKNTIFVDKHNEIKNDSKLSFEEVFHKTRINKELKISKHAIEKMHRRNIELSKTQINKIENALEKAENKGINETLLLMDDIILIASVKNKTVITAVTSKNLKEQVFTNIDGAVII